MKGTGMKYLLFIILLVVILITAGCVGGNKETVVTLTPQTTKNTATISDEPIVGNWQWTTDNGIKIYKFYFFPDGRYSYTDPTVTDTSTGTWNTIRENVYNVSYLNGKTQTFIYNRTTDTFSIPEFSQVLAYRLGKEPVATIPTTVPTTIPVLYLKGRTECDSEKFYEICMDNDVKVSLLNNNVSASGTIFFKSIQYPSNYNLGQYDAYQSLKEAKVSAKLKIYNNNNVKVAEISKSFSVDKNGKSHIELNTEISENNPIGWTYIISIDKNPDAVTSITTNPTLGRPIGTLCSADYASYRYGSQWTVSGIARNDGASGKCQVFAVLLGTNGVELDQRSQILSLSSGESQSFRMEFVDTTNRGVSVKVTISEKQ